MVNGEWKIRLMVCGALAAAAVPIHAVAQAPAQPTTAKPPAKPAAEPLGRMFFTPSQRASLDVARTQRARGALVSEKADEAGASPVPQTLTFDGVVRRSDGRSTFWINNRPVNENEQANSAVVVGRVRRDGGILVQVPQTGRSVELKVGQSIELLSGTIEESYARKPPAAAPEVKPAAKPASPERAATERDREDQQRKREESTRAPEEAAAKTGTAPVAPQQQPPR